ncbi:putative ABC transport system ATP-binding protein [Metabacillus crassostreae]|uniref:ABC transporter ATP-binding protein n=1 Tax=Metabacillus crassostreae TaxID=929098 RepID=UPI00195708BE|nr:ABC transporter ATP-binding protein [Metabacillus crassostreae]MBM7602495.1 putative ABC transport system ATP-binding protein [Metabacillus crassostreae]
MEILNVQNVTKVYKPRLGAKVEALVDINFTVKKGEYIAIMGESGSGKTTLLNILASLDDVTEGEVMLEGVNYQSIKNEELAAFRRKHLGFVFQDFNLLDQFNLKDNIFLPLVLANKSVKEMNEKVIQIAETLGIDHVLDKYPYEVSGGQQQRAAVARALITSPSLILADEPTGALDSRSANELLDLLSKFHESGQTIIMVTHSVYAASKASRVLFIKDGKIISEIRKSYVGEDLTQQIFNMQSSAVAKRSHNE